MQSAIDRLLTFPRFSPPGTERRMATLCAPLQKTDWWRSNPCIKIAGSNGKGTCAHMLESLAMNAGLSVGVYTSPHLISIRERIRLNGEDIDEHNFEQALYWALERAAPVAGRFEILTAASLFYFCKCNVDLAIMEVGLGGRLDPVRLSPGTISILTSIDLEHSAILGNTLEQIAYEKAHVTKPGDTLIAGWPVKAVHCPQDVKIIDHSSSNKPVFELNATLACHAFNAKTDYTEAPETLHNVRPPGRFDVIDTPIKTILDVAHSPEAVRSVLNQLPNNQQIALIIGTRADKNTSQICQMLRHRIQSVAAVQLNEDMSPSETILQNFSPLPIQACENIAQAYDFAQRYVSESGCILVLGGFDVVRHMTCHLNGYDVNKIILI